jgi:hypothetical protein
MSLSLQEIPFLKKYGSRAAVEVEEHIGEEGLHCTPFLFSATRQFWPRSVMEYFWSAARGLLD